MKRKIYLQMRSRAEARQLFLDRFADRRTEAETVAARSACGRVTAGPVSARFSSPLGVYDFQKRTSLIRVSKAGAQTLGRIASTLAHGEGLPAHARSAEFPLDS